MDFFTQLPLGGLLEGSKAGNCKKDSKCMGEKGYESQTDTPQQSMLTTISEQAIILL